MLKAFVEAVASQKYKHNPFLTVNRISQHSLRLDSQVLGRKGKENGGRE